MKTSQVILAAAIGGAVFAVADKIVSILVSVVTFLLILTLGSCQSHREAPTGFAPHPAEKLASVR